MSAPTASPEGYYFVHTCEGRHTDPGGHECNGRFVWAESASEARRGSGLVSEPLRILAEREPDADKHRDVLGDVWSPWKKFTEAEARALRDIGWTQDEDHVCDVCCMGEFDEIPESLVCGGCGMCLECAQDDGDETCSECHGGRAAK